MDDLDTRGILIEEGTKSLALGEDHIERFGGCNARKACHESPACTIGSRTDQE